MNSLLPYDLLPITSDNAHRLTALAELPHPWGTGNLAFSPDGMHLVTGKDALRIWRLADGARESVLQSGEGVIRDLAFRPDGTLLAAAATDGTVRLWAVGAGVQMGVLRGVRMVMNGVAYSPDGTFVAAGTGDFAGERPDGNCVHLWDGHNRWNLTTLDEPASEACVAFSPDGALLAAGESLGGVWLWPLHPLARPDYLKLSRLPAAQDHAHDYDHAHDHEHDHDGAGVLVVAFASDGALLAAGGYGPAGGVITLWDVDAGAPVMELVAGCDEVHGLAWTPDDALIAGGGWSQTFAPGVVHIWDVTTGALLAELAGHTRPLEDIAFSPNGTLLASGGEDGVLLWGVRP